MRYYCLPNNCHYYVEPEPQGSTIFYKIMRVYEDGDPTVIAVLTCKDYARQICVLIASHGLEEI